MLGRGQVWEEVKFALFCPGTDFVLLQITPRPRFHPSPDYTLLQISPRPKIHLPRFHLSPDFTLPQPPSYRFLSSPDFRSFQIFVSCRSWVASERPRAQIHPPRQFSPRADSLPAQIQPPHRSLCGARGVNLKRGRIWREGESRERDNLESRGRLISSFKFGFSNMTITLIV